jgi:pimeloyl-ACP methyl ester carboxylesterase
MPTISTSVGQVAYDSGGSGPPIVLLPSGAHDRQDYDELRALLPSRFRTIGIDWPAHGESPAWTEAADESRLTQLVEEIIESLAPEGAVLAGHSIGGNVAARLAIRRPDLVAGLVLIDAGGFEKPQISARVFCALMGRPWFVRLIYPGFSKWYMRSRTAADARARASAIATTRSPAGRKAVSEMWSSFNAPAHDLRDAAEQITAPTVVVWGRRDPVLPVGAAKTAGDLIRGSKLLLIGSGHSPHTTDPAAVAAELVPLLEAAFPGAAEETDHVSIAPRTGGRR